ncbi:MAG: hypothetical protein ACK4V6_05455 [Microthrixaceae bacterium]
MVSKCRETLEGNPDELGLAAMLESWGITDASAKELYGADDVFSLARSLQVRLQVEERGVGLAPARVPLLTPAWLLRGATYLPSALFVVIALSHDVAGAAAVAFAVVTCIGWGVSEAVSHIAHAAINRGGLGAIRRTFEQVLIAGAPLAAVAAVSTSVASGSVTAGLLIGVQLLYLLAATILLPQGREGMLLIALSPALVAAALAFHGSGPRYFVEILALSLVGEIVVIIVIVVRLRRAERHGHGAPTRADLVAASPFLVAGVAMGVFALACTSIVLEQIGSRRALIGLIVPLMLSMGLSEIGIRRYQHTVQRDLVMSVRLGQFAGRARRRVLVYASTYLALLVALVVGARAIGPDGTTPSSFASYALIGLLGMSLFLTLVHMVIDHVVPVATTYSVAALVLVGWFVDHGAATRGIVQPLAVSIALVTVLLASALVAVAHPARHGFG